MNLRTKLMIIVGIASGALIILMMAGALIGARVGKEITSIEGSYVPQLKVGPQLKNQFERVYRGLQDAVAAQDTEALNATRTQKNLLLEQLVAAKGVLDPKQTTTLRSVVEDSYAAAYDVSRRLIHGETGEALVDAMNAMQAKQARAVQLLESATAFDETELTQAFAVTRIAQATGAHLRLLISAACMVLVLLLSVWVGRGILHSLTELTAGLERFGGGNFDKPIMVTSHDEIGAVAQNANRMAECLKRLGEERDRADWLRKGQVSLADELRGELELEELAYRAVRFLASYLEAPAAAFYSSDGQDLCLISHYSLSSRDAESDARPTFHAGEGLARQAALAGELMLVRDPPEDYLCGRSELGEGRPSVLCFFPLAHLDKVTGVLELAFFRPWSESSRTLLVSVKETLAIAMEVARGRAALRELLRETQGQAQRLLLQDRELRSANEELQSFSYSVSHDLRAPLRAMDGFSKGLLAEYAGQFDEKGLHYLKRIRAGTQRMSALIDDLLNLSRITRADMARERVNVTELARNVAAELQTRNPERAVEVRIQEQLATHADSHLVTILLENLMGNAWKFTAKQVRAHIDIGQEEQECEKVFYVRDNGAGFDMRYANKLFAPFQRLHTAQEFDGTGIGLATVHRIVARHGGRVWTQAVADKGATFFFTLGGSSD